MKAVENRRVMNQSGAYVVANNGAVGTSAVPSSGKTTPIGYMCAFMDTMGCPAGQTRFRDKCHKAQDKPLSFDDAISACKTSGTKGMLPKVEDDDLNQFLADFAAEKFKSEKARTVWVNALPPKGDQPWSYSESAGMCDGGAVTFFRWWFTSGGIKISNGQNPVVNFERESCLEGVKFGYWTVADVSS
ncbi:hypothetical protein PENTCL1PPCAC_24406, partial [Pristionchus entomophagus]